MCIFINGTLDNCITNNNVSARNTSGGLNTGAQLNDGTDPFDGLISRVEIWNRDLTAAEIEANVQQSFQPTLSDPNLVAYYPFTEGSGTTTADQSGNNNNGILVSNPTWTTLVCGSGILCCDPHFTGLDGSSYVVQVSKDGLYNIVSGCGIIVNQMFFTAKFSNGFGMAGQWVNETHIVLETLHNHNGSQKVVEKYLVSYTLADTKSFFVNGKRLINEWNSGSSNNSVSHNDNKNDFEQYSTKIHIALKNSDLIVDTHRYRFVVQVASYQNDEKEKKTLVYQNLAMSVKGLMMGENDGYELHGLLGQTANRPKGFQFKPEHPIEGNPDEYHVSAKYAHDMKFDKYRSISKCKKNHKNFDIDHYSNHKDNNGKKMGSIVFQKCKGKRNSLFPLNLNL